MERGWERVYPFRELDRTDLARLIAGAWPDARLVSALPLASGLRNSNYRLELAGRGTVVLRIYVADPDACGRETAVLASLAGRVPAPRLLYSDRHARPPFALLEWLDGRPLDEVLAALADEADAASALGLASACGAALARIHETKFPATGFLGADMRIVRPMPTWASAMLAELAGPAEERLGAELAAAVRSVVESQASLVEPVWSEAVLLHADYKAWNLLTDRADRWRLTGILDWEFACAGCKLIDFATFLRDEDTRPAGFGDAFAGAYRAAGGSLPADWRRLSRLVDLLNMLQLLNHVDDRAAVVLAGLVAATVSGR